MSFRLHDGGVIARILRQLYDVFGHPLHRSRLPLLGLAPFPQPEFNGKNPLRFVDGGRLDPWYVNLYLTRGFNQCSSCFRL